MSHISNYGGHIYVAVGQNGLLKVGLAGNVLNRTNGLSSDFVRRGDRIERMLSSGVISNPRSIELDLIGFCGRHFKRYSPRGREWYVGADFDMVLSFATSLVGELRPVNLTRPWQEGGRRWVKAAAICSQIKETTRHHPKPCPRLIAPDLPAPAKQEAT